MPFAFQVIADKMHSQFAPEDNGFFLANNTDAVIDAGTDEVIFLHHSDGKNPGFDLFSFSVSNSKADSWIFMLIAHGYAPFDFAVAAGVIDNFTATGIYSL